jgi:hypothetical protein
MRRRCGRRICAIASRSCRRSLSSGERRTLRAIAEGHTTVIPRSAQQALDLPRQTSEAARERLLGAGLIDGDGRTGYRFIDPLFGRWTRRLAYPER